MRGTGTVSDDVQFSNLQISSMQKPLLSGESESFTKVLMENKDSSIPISSFSNPVLSKSSEMASKISQQLDKLVLSTEKSISSFSNPVPSKSSEMASKISQQLDKLVLSTEKSPMKLSSSMLRGQLLESLENVDSSMLLENNVHTSLPDARDSYPQKEHAFQMSAHEDYLEMDADDYFSGTLSAVTSTESRISAGVSSFTSAGGSLGGTSAITGTGSSMFGFSAGASPAACTGSSIFGFSAGSSSAATNSQSLFSNAFTAGNAQASGIGNGVVTSSQTMPVQFGSSSTSSSFGVAGNPCFSSSSSPFGSSISAAKPFSLSPTFGLNSATSLSEANSNNSGSGTTPSVFGSSWQAPTNPSLFGSTFSSTTAPTFQFGAATTSVATNNAPVFGSSSTGTSSNSIFPFASTAAATSSQPAFGNGNPIVPYGYASSNNNDQISMEDIMAEDTIQSLTPTVPVFGQQSITPVASGSAFGPAAPPSSPYHFSSGDGGGFLPPKEEFDTQRRILKLKSKQRRSGWNSSIPSAAPPSSPYQFSSEQNLADTQNSSNRKKSRVIGRELLFGLTLDVGCFSLGAGGGDKSQKRILKMKRKQRRKQLYCIHTDRKN